MSLSLESKAKARWARIRRTYGLSANDYAVLDLGHCPICLRGWAPKVQPVIDHDHVGKYVRGIICRACNHRTVGNHRDSTVLRRVADYLDNAPRNYVVPVKKKKKKNVRKVLPSSPRPTRPPGP